MLDMAEQGDGAWLRLSDIAQRQQLSKKYLESIMAALSRAGVGGKLRGQDVRLPADPSAGEYPVGEILRAAEGDLCAVSCISEEKAGCGSVCDCGTRSFWQGLEAQINTYVDHYTLAQFMHSGEKSTGRSCGAEGE